MLPIIVQHGVVESINALEIFRVQNVLGADLLVRRGSKIGLEHPQHRSEDRSAWQTKFGAFGLQPLDQGLVEKGIERDAGLGLNRRQHAIELLAGAHRGINVFDGDNTRVLRRGRTRDGNQRFTGRIGYQMKMKKADGLRGHTAVDSC